MSRDPLVAVAGDVLSFIVAAQAAQFGSWLMPAAAAAGAVTALLIRELRQRRSRGRR